MFQLEKKTQLKNTLVPVNAGANDVASISNNLVKSDGIMTAEGQKTVAKLKVQYKGYWFAVRASQHGTQAVLGVYALLGNLPYTYQSPFLRKNLSALVMEAGRELGGRVHLDDQQRIILSDYIKKEGAISPHFILTETTKVIFKIRPYLELITALQPPKPKA